MANLEKAPAILEKALAEWRKIQTLKKEKTSVSEFANFIEYSQTTVSLWLNGDREISEDAITAIAPKLAELLGTEIYDTLGLPRPEENLAYIESIWNKLAPEQREHLKNQAEKFIKRKNG